MRLANDHKVPAGYGTNRIDVYGKQYLSAIETYR